MFLYTHSIKNSPTTCCDLFQITESPLTLSSRCLPDLENLEGDLENL